MSKMKKRFNRRERRTLFYKSRVKAGCLIMALSLAMLAPGAGQVHAADADKKVEKKVVSENKTKSDKDRSDKKKDGKKDPDVKQEDKETEADTGKPTQAPRETAEPQPSATPQTPAEEPTGPAKEQTGDQASTDESSQGPEADGVTEPAATGTPGDSVSADAGGASGSPEGEGRPAVHPEGIREHRETDLCSHSRQDPQKIRVHRLRMFQMSQRLQTADPHM